MTKPFSSKSLEHIKKYPLVQKILSIVFSLPLVNTVYLYATALTNFIYSNIIIYIPFATRFLVFADNNFDGLVLSVVDSVLSITEAILKRVETVLAEYKKKGDEYVSTYKQVGDEYKKKAQGIAGAYKKKGEDTVSSYLKPINDNASNTVDKVLPKVKEAKDAGESAQAEASNEIYKSIEIVHDTLNRSKHLISSKSNDLSNTVISTYNKEFDSAANEQNYYAKVASASINTGVSLLKSVNDDYIKPLKDTTQTYVEEKASPYKEKAQITAENAKESMQDIITKGSTSDVPFVSASA